MRDHGIDALQVFARLADHHGEGTELFGLLGFGVVDCILPLCNQRAVAMRNPHWAAASRAQQGRCEAVTRTRIEPYVQKKYIKFVGAWQQHVQNFHDFSLHEVSVIIVVPRQRVVVEAACRAGLSAEPSAPAPALRVFLPAGPSARVAAGVSEVVLAAALWALKMRATERAALSAGRAGFTTSFLTQGVYAADCTRLFAR